jgi:hypothetical protein
MLFVTFGNVNYADLSVQVMHLPGKNRLAEAIWPSHPGQETLDKLSQALHEAHGEGE